MKIIGLTGGIGSGKSTASSYLRKKGFAVIDADEVARQVAAPGAPVLSRLAEAFGPDIIEEDGRLNRKKLASMVFCDAKKRECLDGIMHGEILRQIRSALKEYRKEAGIRAVFVDAPLLFETGLDRDCETVWLIVADKQVRIERVSRRDGITAGEVEARIDNQMSDEEKVKLASVRIDNSGDEAALYEQLERYIGGI